MVTPNSSAATEFSTPANAQSSSFAGDWIGRFKVDGLSLSLSAGVVIEDIASGVTPQELGQLAAKELLEIRAALGTNRRSLAQAIHRQQASDGSVLVDLDGDRHDADTTVARLVSILTELAASKEAASSSQNIRNSAVFVDNAQFLCETSQGALQALIDLRRKGGIVPRIIIGCVAGCDAGLNGLESFTVKPLRERPDDVAAFVERRFRSRRNAPNLNEDAYAKLRDHKWLGEESELLQFVTRAQLEYAGAEVSPEAVTVLLDQAGRTPGELQPLAEIEEAHIYRVLEHNGWNRTRSAKTLGIDVKTLYNKLRRYESKKRVANNNS